MAFSFEIAAKTVITKTITGILILSVKAEKLLPIER